MSCCCGVLKGMTCCLGMWGSKGFKPPTGKRADALHTLTLVDWLRPLLARQMQVVGNIVINRPAWQLVLQLVPCLMVWYQLLIHFSQTCLSISCMYGITLNVPLLRPSLGPRFPCVSTCTNHTCLPTCSLHACAQHSSAHHDELCLFTNLLLLYISIESEGWHCCLKRTKTF